MSTFKFPSRGAGSGGGSGGSQEVSLGTLSTGDLASSASVDLDFPLPSGITSALITKVLVSITAGASSYVKVLAYRDDAREDDPLYLLGSSFGGDPPDTIGPVLSSGSSAPPLAVPYFNSDDSEFLRAQVTNAHFEGSATFSVEVFVVPT